MDDRCSKLINEVLFKEQTQDEWRDLQRQFEAIANTSTEEELALLEESGIEEILYMICS